MKLSLLFLYCFLTAVVLSIDYDKYRVDMYLSSNQDFESDGTTRYLRKQHIKEWVVFANPNMKYAAIFGDSKYSVFDPYYDMISISLLDTFDYVLAVDWSSDFPYKELIDNDETVNIIYLVGRKIAGFFVKNKLHEPGRIYMVGHGMGVQIASRIAKNFLEKVDQITGIDPAFISNRNYRLRPDDAKYVDVIHTGVGSNVAMGHLDFFTFLSVDNKTKAPNCRKCDHGCIEMGGCALFAQNFNKNTCDLEFSLCTDVMTDSDNNVIGCGGITVAGLGYDSSKKIKMPTSGVYVISNYSCGVFESFDSCGDFESFD